jgi:PAS domain S-box-containing protein
MSTAHAELVAERDRLASRLRATFEASPVSTVVYDNQGRPVAVNPAFERLWGASLSDVPAEYSVLTDPQLRAAGVLDDVRRAFAGETVTLPALRYEMEAAVGRGRILWTEGHLYPVLDGDGRVEQVVLTHQDVTRRHEAEVAAGRALEQAQRLLVLTNALSVASSPHDVASAIVRHAASVLEGESVIVARISDDGRHLEVLDVGRSDVDVMGDWATFPLDTEAPLAEVARTGEAVFIESDAMWAERYPSFAALAQLAGHHANVVVPLVANASVLGAMGVAYAAERAFNESDRALATLVAQYCAQALDRSRLFEAERTARGAAEAANEAKSQFLTTMSHELRTPLNAIAGYTELILLGLRGPVTDAQRTDLERVQGSQRHLLGLNNEVLNYARLVAGTVHYDLRAVDVGAVVQEALTLVAPQAAAKGLAIDGQGPRHDGERIVVRADREKCVQILINLLSNAVKFTERGSIGVRWSRAGEMARVVVKDTGIGIDDRNIERVFDPFVQVRSPRSRTSEGTGLGLSISRELARAMGGELTVDSSVGHGSSFVVELPLAPQ